jgi:hypothetical protein
LLSAGPTDPVLAIEVQDDGFVLAAESVAADRYTVQVTNTGTSPDAHSGLVRLPDTLTKEDFIAFINSPDGEGFDVTQLIGAGQADWPAPGATVTGTITLDAGTWVLFDPFGVRGYAFLSVTGEVPVHDALDADCEFIIGEFVIDLPKDGIRAGAQRWHIANKGAIVHELAVLQVPEGFTIDDFMALAMLPPDATPTPDMKVITFTPVAGIGALGTQRESWLDLNLPGAAHYMAVCMVPDADGVPHVMSGMYAFFDIA